MSPVIPVIVGGAVVIGGILYGTIFNQTSTPVPGGIADTLPEGTGERQQCYLLNGCFVAQSYFKSVREATQYGSGPSIQGVQVAPTGTSNKNINANNRMCFYQDVSPELWFNQLSYPDAAQEMFTTSYPYLHETTYDFYIVKKNSTTKKMEKINVNSALLGANKPVPAQVESINITYKGTNPASARSDIDVKIIIKVNENLSALKKDIKTTNINNEATTFKLIDVILRPEFVRDAKGLSRWKRSQFHPDYNRTELVIHNSFSKSEQQEHDKTTGKIGLKDKIIDNSISYALTMTDHGLDVDAGGTGFTITLNYKSYVEQVIGLPYTDVFANTTISQNREKRDKKIATAVVTNNKAQEKKERDNNKTENAKEVKDGIQRLKTRIKDENLWYAVKLQGQIVPKKQVNFSGVAYPQKDIENLNDLLTRNPNTDPESYVQFVYLADLIGVAMDVFFDKDWDGQGTKTEDYAANFKEKLEIKTMFMNLVLPHPKAANSPGSKMTVNIGRLPISKDFLEKFLEDRYVKKSLVYAPFQGFVRSLCEKAITKAISRTCFINSEWKGSIKVNFVKALKETWTDIQKFKDDSANAVTDLNNAKLREIFKNKMGSRSGKEDKDYVTYMVVHASEQAEVSNMMKEALSPGPTKGPFIVLQDQVPKPLDDVLVGGQVTIPSRPYSGEYFANESLYAHSTGLNFSFKRVDGKYRRESIYTEYKSNAFVAIGNVYSATINFKNACCNWFYPGNIVILNPHDGDFVGWNDSSKLGNRLGITGFYLINSVVHDIKLGETTTATTKIEAVWVYSALGDLRKLKPGDLDPREPTPQQLLPEANPIKGKKNKKPKNKKTTNPEEIKGKGNKVQR